MQKSTALTTLIIAITFAAALAWVGRYEIIGTTTHDDHNAYRLDRWTGEVLVYQRRPYAVLGVKAEVYEGEIRPRSLP